MILFMPKLYKEFECIGSKCKDNCCKTDWDIEIDDSTYNFYKQLKVQQNPDGEKFLSNIEEDDDCRYLKHDGGCPMLNKDGLCSLQLKYGEEHISEICRNHPRFFEWFGGYKECGVGLACEEAVDLWLKPERIEFMYDTDENEEDDDLPYDADLLKFALKVRDRMFSIMHNRKQNVFARMCSVLDFSHKIDKAIYIDGMEFADDIELALDKIERSSGSIEEYKNGNTVQPEETLKNIFSEIEKMEFMNEQTKTFFISSGRNANKEKIFELAESLKKSKPQYFIHYENLMIYYIFRWFIKGVREEDFETPIKFAFFSVAVIWAMDILNWAGHKDEPDDNIHKMIIEKYSKEIEYSYENLEKLFEDLACLPEFSVQNLLRLYK